MTEVSARRAAAVVMACTRAAIAALLLLAAREVSAHSNPPTCGRTYVTLDVEALRDTDGTTLPGEHGPGDTVIRNVVEPGETVYYQARLTQFDNETCGYEGGTVCIDPPGPTGCTDVTPPAGIRLVCGEPTCNPVGVTSFFLTQLAYLVDDADRGGECGDDRLMTYARYRDATSHYGQFGGDAVGVQTSYSYCHPVVTPAPTATPLATTTTTPTPTLTLGPTPKPTTAAATRCQRAIAAASFDYVDAIASAVDACERHPANGTAAGCAPHNLSAAAEAAERLRDTVDAACGGRDRRCATPDDNDPLAAIDWDRGECPGIAGGDCRNAIADCGDVAQCLVCIGETAVDSTVERLLYDRLRDGELGTGSAANRCAMAIGKAGVRAFEGAVRALGQCWRAKASAKSGFADADPCPDTDPRAGVGSPPAAAGDNRTVVMMKKATQKAAAAICKACGAGGDGNRDGRCDAPPGLALAAFARTPFVCPDVEVPASARHPEGVDCGAIAVTDLQSYVDCVSCVVDFHAGCSSDAAVGEDAVDGFTYAPQCRPNP